MGEEEELDIDRDWNISWGLPNMSAFNIGDENVTVSSGGDPRTKRLWQIGVGLVLPSICVFGIVGNALSLLVLNRNKFNQVMFIYVRWMAASDMVGMLFFLPECMTKVAGITKFNTFAEAWYFAHLSVPISNILFGCSSLLVVSMTVERYVSVCHPLKSKLISTTFGAHIVIAVVYVISFTVYIPTFFEFDVLQEAIVGNKEYFKITWNREYASGEFYSVIYQWSRTSLIRFLPFIIIISLNSCTLHQYMKILKRRRAILNRAKKDERRFKEENNIIIVLICTAVIYVVCLTPMPIANILRTSGTMDGFTFSFQVFLVIGNNLEILNAAMNFYMYCVACRDIRQCLKMILSSFGRWSLGKTFARRKYGHHKLVMGDSAEFNSQYDLGGGSTCVTTNGGGCGKVQIEMAGKACTSSRESSHLNIDKCQVADQNIKDNELRPAANSANTSPSAHRSSLNT